MNRFREIIRESWRESLGMFLPTPCVGCGSGTQLACESCLHELAGPGIQFREIINPHSGHSIPVSSAWSYGPTSAGFINSFKEHGVTALARVFAVALHASLEQLRSDIPSSSSAMWIAPPTTRASYRERGYWPVGVIAQRAGIRLVPALTFVRGHSDHAGLDARQREANMAGALQVDRPLAGCDVILFDDVITSGATLRECARAVAQAGGHVVAGLTLAYAGHEETFRNLPAKNA